MAVPPAGDHAVAVTDDVFDLDDDGSVVLRLHVQPGAGRTSLVGRHGDALKVRVAVPPEQGRANQACTELLAATFGLAEGQVELVGGRASRSKRVRLRGLELDEFRRLLGGVLAAPADTGREPRPGGNVRPGRSVR